MDCSDLNRLLTSGNLSLYMSILRDAYNCGTAPSMPARPLGHWCTGVQSHAGVSAARAVRHCLQSEPGLQQRSTHKYCSGRAASPGLGHQQPRQALGHLGQTGSLVCLHELPHNIKHATLELPGYTCTHAPCRITAGTRHMLILTHARSDAHLASSIAAKSAACLPANTSCHGLTRLWLVLHIDANMMADVQVCGCTSR